MCWLVRRASLAGLKGHGFQRCRKSFNWGRTVRL
jgi:hypothetical protein